MKINEIFYPFTTTKTRIDISNIKHTRRYQTINRFSCLFFLHTCHRVVNVVHVQENAHK